jgi:hypothetical protein
MEGASAASIEPRPTGAKLGFIGVGNMGRGTTPYIVSKPPSGPKNELFPPQLTPAGMALNLSRKGFALLVYDACLARVEETFPPSQVAAGGLRQLAQECDRIIFCLPDYTILQRVLFGSSSASSSSSADEGDRGLVAFLKPGMCDQRTPCIDIRCTHGTHGTHGTRTQPHAHGRVQGMCWWTAELRIRCGRRRRSDVCAKWASPSSTPRCRAWWPRPRPAPCPSW